MKLSKVTPKNSVTFRTTDSQSLQKTTYKWWLAENKDMLKNQVLTSAAYLKETQSYIYRQASMFARLYGNMSLFNFVGTNIQKLDNTTGLPSDRPTYNVIQSCVDTVVAKINQSKPNPVFLTEEGDYKERRLAKQLNNFILGEFYQTKTYEKVADIVRDACIFGTGILKVYETEDHKVGLERKLKTELLVDPNDSMYGEPRQLFEMKLIDRDVLKAICPGYNKDIDVAVTAFPDGSGKSSETVADQVMVVEAWHLPSGKGKKDGRHVIVCSSAVLLDEPFTKEKFPFVFLHYAPRSLGFWAQGLAEQLMGSQLEINSLLFTISKAIKLVGVPRVFMEDGSKVMSSAFNNDIGTIIKYRGIKPIYEVAPCVPQELYAQLQRVIDYAYQQCGVSSLDASSKKPAGLNSGEAIRSYDDISSDRLATLNKRFISCFIDLTYAMVDKAKDIAEEQGSYQTIYPNKNGTKQIDLPEMKFIQDPFVVRAYDESALPHDPAGRMQTVTEWIQAGMVTIKEGRRLLAFPDLQQDERLDNASEERIFQTLDKMVEDGIYTPPDPFMDLQLASELTVKYYNLYAAAKLEEERCEMLRTFYSQIQTLSQQAQGAMAPPAAAGAQSGAPVPQAAPQPQPTSPLVPNTPGGP